MHLQAILGKCSQTFDLWSSAGTWRTFLFVTLMEHMEANLQSMDPIMVFNRSDFVYL